MGWDGEQGGEGSIDVYRIRPMHCDLSLELDHLTEFSPFNTLSANLACLKYGQ